MGLQDKLYNISPDFFQNLLITFYNLKSYKNRYGKRYWKFKNEFLHNNSLTKDELKEIQLQKAKNFLKYASENSEYYSKIIDKNYISNIQSVSDIESLPFLDKELLRKNIDEVVTINKSDGIIAKTGGTTGISLEVLFTKEDIQARFAFVDNVRNSFGYKLGKKTAWFSGKKLINQSDINKKRFWKTDYVHNVRYYSTFHIQQENLEYYIQNLIKFAPEYLVGFPSNMYELAKYGLRKKINFPNTIKGIFTNAETLTLEMRNDITLFFKCEIYDQYSSAEGSPFIFQCKEGKYHMELQSGIFEVLDNQNNNVDEGRLVVTSFYTHGTPLIRYEIGDHIKISGDTESCSCGNNNPLIKYILGRKNDYIFSEETGKINGGNISNCTKNTHGIIKFQVIQDKRNEIEVKLIIDESIYSKVDEEVFVKNMKDRLGNNMKINIYYVTNIQSEKSGKFRLIKNNIKALIEN